MKLLLPVFLLLTTITYAQHGNIDVAHYHFKLSVNDTTNYIEGQASIRLRYLSDMRELGIDLDTGMHVSSVIAEGKVLPFTHEDKLQIPVNAKAGDTCTYIITYGGIPRDGLIISNNKFEHRTFFTDHWPDRAHQWIPCNDHPSDKATVDFTVIAPAHYQVIANGKKLEETTMANNMKRTSYSEHEPLPIKVMAIGIADFAIDHAGDVGNIPIYTYVFPENKTQGFHDYGLAAKILPFYIDHIGPYAFEKLANVQSKTIFGGMENAGAIFYDENTVGGNRVEPLLAHEIAHQFFGDGVTETDWQHVWLSEGFATYFASMYMESRYGADTLRKDMAANREKIFNYWKRRKTSVVDTTVHDNYMQLLNPNSYEKGGWVLHMLRRQIGDSLYWKGIRTYYSTYNGKNANTENFRNVMETVSGQPLDTFFNQWLYRAGMPILDITWSYDQVSRQLHVKVTQVQPDLYVFPLELLPGNGKIKKVMIRDQVTEISFPMPAKPAIIKADPLVNLLAAITLRPV